MEAKNESTLFFAENSGDKLLIELSITGDPDEVVKKIMRSISKGEELFEGAKCEQVFFKGKGIDDVVDNAVKQALTRINEINNLRN